jgi:glycosyltransferase involved in cell wall biosynthesis
MRKLIKEEPSVDVILPNYNKAEFLEESINSVIFQTYRNWHLYIVDDHSNDNSPKIINQFSDLKNITVITLRKNKGPSFCRNYAMRISKAKYIAFIDSDDSWSKNKLEMQILFMEKNNLTEEHF